MHFIASPLWMDVEVVAKASSESMVYSQSLKDKPVLKKTFPVSRPVPGLRTTITIHRCTLEGVGTKFWYRNVAPDVRYCGWASEQERASEVGGEARVAAEEAVLGREHVREELVNAALGGCRLRHRARGRETWAWINAHCKIRDLVRCPRLRLGAVQQLDIKRPLARNAHYGLGGGSLNTYPCTSATSLPAHNKREGVVHCEKSIAFRLEDRKPIQRGTGQICTLQRMDSGDLTACTKKTKGASMSPDQTLTLS